MIVWVLTSRQGSGSACRSLYGGFVKWIMGKEENGSDSIAVQLADEKHWDDLVIIIAVSPLFPPSSLSALLVAIPILVLKDQLSTIQVDFAQHPIIGNDDSRVLSSRQKETSSTSGMRETVETSMLIEHRAKEVVPRRIIQMEEAIKIVIFHLLLIWLVQTVISFMQIISCVEKWNRFEGTPQVAYTFDAGPNAVLIARNRKAATLLLQRLLFYFPPQSDTDLNSYVIGDKSILQDAGVHGLKDIEALASPPEVKDSIQTQKYKGDVSYFICTRPGRGPVLLTDETQALLNAETGLPK
ncbi:unnamed protein product [Fraxinus pennsylvanica]|uniref:Diphosphomevalonate decarboxylase n=1 Tax=Fraxinus pennsylvanica TaxID=56036 RepID=A0AAD1ZCV7_9LAMI|nr:unnamed protein product [Fraxinus pennsylvanica]